MAQILSFDQFKTFVDPSFWYSLGEQKLNHWRLDESPRFLRVTFDHAYRPNMPCRISVGSDSLSKSPTSVTQTQVNVTGCVYLLNTVEAFKNFNFKNILNTNGVRILDEIKDEIALIQPSLLNCVILVAYADMKKYIYKYWFAYPALCIPNKIRLVRSSEFLPSPDLKTEIFRYIKSLRSSQPFFICNEKCVPFSSLMAANKESLILIFPDPSSSDKPSWVLRNILACIAINRPQITSLSCVGWRERVSFNEQIDFSQWRQFDVTYDTTLMDSPSIVGWELNAKGVLGPQTVDLSDCMDPNRQAASALSLNLSLMRWRILPELDLDKIVSTKCLLFGAGTLGCNVARCLMAWGVRQISLIDNGRVSMSNPARQSLFTIDQARKKMHKAEGAAQSLKEVFPLLNVTAYVLTVPMPGHIILDDDEFKSTVEKIDRLVQEHDLIFLLMDTREGRWLPALLSAAYNKICISTALGFDSYVIMRHGGKTNTDNVDEGEETQSTSNLDAAFISGADLGCYFCMDVTAPGNSTHDRTLDQQCTVSRAGISLIASGLAVELAMSIIQHPLMANAPAPVKQDDSNAALDLNSCLGAVPHQLRGYLCRFEQNQHTVARFGQCVACSRRAVEAYQSQGLKLIKECIESPSKLEATTGLDKLQAQTDEIDLREFSDVSSSVSGS